MRARIAVVLAGAVAVTGFTTQAATAAQDAAVSTVERAAAPAQRPTLKLGSKGDAVRQLQNRLKQLHYDPGTADGRFGTSTRMAVWAFQKVNRLTVNGTVDAAVWKALDAPRQPQPLTKRREADRVDVDLTHQYLVVYKGGKLRLISHVSAGSGKRYCTTDPKTKKERCRRAVTPTGDYRTLRRIDGWRNAPLGRLYNPIYFNGGIAFHGAPSVPDYPASHGCVRLPMHIAEYFPKIVSLGVAVHVRRPA
ncbi:peptidoglycan-binding protein [Actinomadura sp. NBRC 104425]|uniref:L,D-transpeptidase family protein n=1 Tax=Actinomadura sp. NBRC 104425 TaxID=3032204 RepID=UPI0024A3B460|nr:L,D-transpeptidase family protein [Actinomadura sp. NBRC 104425]GLZ10519.1 peptidoglycan-binding protein [Actinomadura sp. NBRC 104425]